MLAKERQVVSTGEQSLFRGNYREGFVLPEIGLPEKGVAHGGRVFACP